MLGREKQRAFVVLAILMVIGALYFTTNSMDIQSHSIGIPSESSATLGSPLGLPPLNGITSNSAPIEKSKD